MLVPVTSVWLSVHELHEIGRVGRVRETEKRTNDEARQRVRDEHGNRQRKRKQWETRNEKRDRER